MNANDLITLLNNENSYFHVHCDDKETSKYEIKYSINNQLMNEIVSDLIGNMIDNAQNNILQETSIFEKWMNYYSKLYKLSESIDEFHHFNSHGSTFMSQTVDYVDFLRRKILEVLDKSKNNDKNNKAMNNHEFGVNRCLGCGVDMGDCNPRQYCCKTYCPVELERFDNESQINDWMDDQQV